jgi:hypothetical protein
MQLTDEQKDIEESKFIKVWNEKYPFVDTTIDFIEFQGFSVVTK